MYSLLKTNISLLLKDFNIYKNVKDLFINCIKNKYLKMNNPSTIMMKTVSDCLTIVIVCGVKDHWPTCIEDLINESLKENINYCYTILRALGSIDYIINYNGDILVGQDYEDSVIISERDKLEIKDKLIENKDLVINRYKGYNEICMI